jgi:hypothetical protein
MVITRHDRFLRRERIKLEIYEWMLEGPQSIHDVQVKFNLQKTAATLIVNELLNDRHVTRFTGKKRKLDKLVYLHRSSPLNRYAMKAPSEQQIKAKDKAAGKKETGQFGGKVIVDQDNPNKRTYINLDRKGSDYSYQRKKHSATTSLSSSMAWLSER